MRKFPDFKIIEEFIDDINSDFEEDFLAFVDCFCSDIIVQFHSKDEYDKLIDVLETNHNFLICLSIEVEYDFNNLRLNINDFENEFENVCEELKDFECDIFEFRIITLRLSEILSID